MNRKSLRAVVTTSFFTFILLIACCLTFLYSIDRTFYRISEKEISNATEQGIKLVGARMDDMVSTITVLADYGLDNPEKSVEQSLAAMSSQVAMYGYARLGFAGVDGVAYTTDKFVVDIRERDWFKEALDGKIAISDMLDDKIGDGGKIVVMAVPVYENSEIVGVFFCTQAASNFVEMTSVSFFNNSAGSFVIDKEGGLLFTGSGVDERLNLFDSISGGTFTKEALEKQLSSDPPATLMATIDGEECFVGFAAIPNFPERILVVTAEKQAMMAEAVLLNHVVFAGTGIIGVAFIVIISRNILYRKKHSKNMEYIAFMDTLTGISNASLFYLEVQNKLNSIKTEKYALVYFDIDNFKMVNDIFGYEAGNQVIKAVAERLKMEFVTGDHYARLFSDHFAIFAKYITQDEFSRYLQSFFNSLSTVEIPIQGKISLEFSAGVYFVKDTLSDVHKIINNANIARGLVKGNKQKQIEFFLENMRSDLTASSAMEVEIRAGIAAGEFDVFYQPKVSVATGEVCGAEALLRWYHPKKGAISPGVFIPVAEKNGLIVELGRWMFEHVCSDLKQLMPCGLDGITVSFNLSKTEIYQRDVVEFIELTMEKYELSGELFEVEITESHEVGNLDLLVTLIGEFKRLGMRVSLDDFGTGYSSLSYLKSIPVDVLKLDKSFVDDITKSDADRDIVKEIISLAKILKLEVVSEGVETAAQCDFVSDNGCDVIQGYYYHKPMSVEMLKKLLSESEKPIKF